MTLCVCVIQEHLLGFTIMRSEKRGRRDGAAGETGLEAQSGHEPIGRVRKTQLCLPRWKERARGREGAQQAPLP